MLRRIVCAVIVMGAGLGVLSAETLKGRIIKIDDKSVTIVVGKKDQKMEKTFDLADKVKVSKGTKKGVKEELSDGLKTEALRNLGKKGRHATVITDASNKVTEIVIAEGKKKNQ